MNNRSQAYNQSCRSKSRKNNKILCSVCYVYSPTRFFSTDYCSKHRTRQICDACVYQHIVSTLNSCLTNLISCPEWNCRMNLSPSVICDLLLIHENNDLLNNYLDAQQWEGNSKEWIQRFTLRCPHCNVPIEKNGGCNQMICTRCGLYFNWLKAKGYKKNDKESDSYEWFGFILGIIFILIFFCVSLYLILSK